MPTESDRQTARGRKGQAIVRVPISPPSQTELGRRGQPFVRVQFPRDAGVEKIRAAADKPLTLTQAFGAPVARAVAPLAELAVDAPAALAGLFTQEGRVKTREGFDLLAGNPYGGPKYAVQPENPVAQALAQGRTAAPPREIPAVDRQSQLIAAILGSNLTVDEATKVTSILPAAAGGGKAPSAKDNVLGNAAKLSEALFQNQVNQATELAKTDPVGARAIVDKATQDHFARQAGLVGFNPVQLAQAALLNGAGEEE